MSGKAAVRSRRTGCLSLNLLRHYHSSKQILNKKLNGYDAVKKIKDLQQCNNNQNMVITEAIKIYSSFDDKTQKNELVITALLNCCKKQMLDVNTINKRFRIWMFRHLDQFFETTSINLKVLGFASS